MTCKRCRVRMREISGHIFHGKRKFRCPQCNRAKMKKPKKREKKSRGSSHSEA
ncbi:hypothetical protein Terro_4332 [Terriglobus roseus DSM 18391]|uniref:Uncharacterized protein n=1 Tax=Terriglobus roseus (strain DSM 18391 / NRRL B-41598 / KBS 63) TaxID=926566 RepID=I3ZMR1_TERRK|nr:hypothetical protein Terro_4332 [Terriglobus roseus DSM 18391]